MRPRLAILLAVLLLLPAPAWGQGSVNARIQDSSGDPITATSGRLHVDGSGVTQPVSGTVTATQGGTWNIGTVTNITNAVTVTDGSGALTVDGTVDVSGTVATNVAQVGGTSVTTGVGSAAAGTMRVAVARDSEVCNPIDTAQVAVAVSASGNTELVPLTSGQTIYVCDVLLVAGGTVDVQLISGTGTACATGETDMTGAVPLVANTGYVHNFNGRLKTAASNALCLELSGAVSVQGTVTYRKF